MNVTLTEKDWERFWAKVEKTDTCWLWAGVTNQDGYGTFSVWRDGKNRVLRVHRLTFVKDRGAIPEGAVVDHICRVRGCVNPEHLRLLTNRENVLAGIGLSAINARKTHCKRGHEFTDENTRITRRGARECRECKRLHEMSRGPRPRRACEACGEVLGSGHMAMHKRRKHQSIQMEAS